MSIGVIASHAAVGGATGYAGAVLADSPLAYYRLGEASGTTMVDSSGNSRNGTYTGVALGTTGLLTSDTDTAATFTGSAKGEVAYASWMNQSSLTVEALINPSSVSGTHVILSRHNDSGATWSFRLDGTALRFLSWSGNSGENFGIAASTATLAAGTRYHVAVTVTSGTAIAFFVNGAAAGTASRSPGINAAATAPLRVGASFAGENFAGVIDEAALYGSALSSGRIAAHYAAA